MSGSTGNWLNRSDDKSCSKIRIAMIVALCLIVGTIFLIIGFFARSCGSGGGGGSNVEFEKLIREADPAMREFSQKRLSAERIRSHLKGLTLKPHVAILESDPAKDYVEAHWKRLFDGNTRVKLTPIRYKVLLSRAKVGVSEENRTHFDILSSDGKTVVFTSQKVEQPLTQYDNDTNIPSPILGYAPSGDVMGGAVYANYGSEADLLYLTRNLSINISGTILLTRFGNVGLGARAVNGKKFGAAGVLMFSDPADIAKNQSAVYPNGYWMPPTGTLKAAPKLESGDPTTPGYPSLESAYRHDAVARGVLPPLPMYPIGYGDARVILDSLEGETAPSNWRVAINGMNASESNPIRVGPAMTGGRRMRLLVNQENYLKEITNLCVEFRGEIEPDRWVIVGNHRDAVGYGAVDPSSGTAVLMEFSQILSDMMTQGWKPRRSIMLCTWDAEEYGLIGSWEYVEENLMSLKESVVAYVNIDIAVAGNYSMRTSAVPCLRTFAKSLMDTLPEEVNPGHSMGDTWSTRWANGKSAMDGMSTPLSGSDYRAFIELAGLPVMDIMFRADPAVTSLYPMYHIRYETFQYVDTYVDPGFKAHLSAARLLTEVTRQLSDEYLLPYALNMTNTALELVTFFNSVNSSRQVINLPSLKTAVDALRESVNLLLDKARAWDAQTVNRRSPLSVRRINDMAMRAMQGFLASRGQPRQPYVNNLVFATGKYGSSVRFPGLGDLLFELASTGEARVEEEVKEQLRDLAYHVRSAAKLLSV